LVSILAGAIIRVVWGLVIHPPLDFLYSDMGSYVERAQRLATAAGLQRPDAFFPPGTHILLAAPMTLFGTERVGLWGGAVLWCLLSAVIPFFAWRLARLLLNPPAAALTALFSPRGPQGANGMITPDTLSTILRDLTVLTQTHAVEGRPLPLITSPQLRVGVRRLVEPVLPALPVVSLAELPAQINLHSVATWELEERQG
jgi:hypothetical protein